MHYASLTFGPLGDADAKPPKTEKAASAPIPIEPQTALAPLPEPVSSFGAAVSDGWLYVYGGHIGGEHEHSAANLSQHFRRIKLEGGAEWEELQMQMPLQGLALIAHGGRIYRVGGLNARNATKDDEEDLHSTADFTVFDPAGGKWESLAPLPAPRSSHNAVVIDGKLYVVGGWHLHGQSPGHWQADALVYDFARPDAGWQELPEPPFKRRAIAAGKWQGKLVVMGGMDEKENISRRVHLFDPHASSWSEGPKLPGTGMMAFGTAACDLDGQIFVTGLQGVVYRLNEAGSAWEEATRMATGRFFHQLVPTSDGRLLAVGGASRENHLADIESIGIP
jgi:N-acetylneuraminic acid mutarotase